MGVSGSGKTTIGKLLAKKTGMNYFDADDFHPQNNIDKMKANEPLTDGDRFPWLTILANNMQHWIADNGFVLACSALKESYRQILSANLDSIQWIYLEGSLDLIQSRMESRINHFMKSNLLESQFEALETPKYGLHLSVEKSPEELVKSIISKLKLNE